jgi:hypothetical protein
MTTRSTLCASTQRRRSRISKWIGLSGIQCCPLPLVLMIHWRTGPWATWKRPSQIRIGLHGVLYNVDRISMRLPVGRGAPCPSLHDQSNELPWPHVQVLEAAGREWVWVIPLLSSTGAARRLYFCNIPCSTANLEGDTEPFTVTRCCKATDPDAK